MLKLPDGTVKVLVEGLQRARISALSDNGEHFSAKAEYLESPTIDEREQEVLVRTAISQFEGYIKLNKKIPPEVLTSLNSIDDPARLADTIAAHMPLKLAATSPFWRCPTLTNVWISDGNDGIGNRSAAG
ncbi:LON peptidase substrate-binding domain-containing protein [Escherichia coli]